MREKYIEEKFPLYFEFGSHKNGNVDIASLNNDTIATVTKEHAKNLINDRNELVSMLCKLALALDEIDHDKFSKIWY